MVMPATAHDSPDTGGASSSGRQVINVDEAPEVPPQEPTDGPPPPPEDRIPRHARPRVTSPHWSSGAGAPTRHPKGSFGSYKAHWFTHSPKDPSCEICRRAQAVNLPARRRRQRSPEPVLRTEEDALVEDFVPKKFGDLITADHIVIGDEQAHSRHGDAAALVCFDRGTAALGVYPAARRTTEETVRVSRRSPVPRPMWR